MTKWWADPEIWRALLMLEVYEARDVRALEIQVFNNIYLEARAIQEGIVNGEKIRHREFAAPIPVA